MHFLADQEFLVESFCGFNLMLGVNFELMSNIGLEEASYQSLVLGSLLIPA
jgi:hypothetical protein